jgi:hypothetical protein
MPGHWKAIWKQIFTAIKYPLNGLPNLAKSEIPEVDQWEWFISEEKKRMNPAQTTFIIELENIK